MGNHFYRPIATLSFELDNYLYGTNAAGYGWTNVLLCIACVLLLFWFLRELTDKPFIAGGGAVLFAIQTSGYQIRLVEYTSYLVALVAVIGIFRHRQRVRYWLPAILVILYTSEEIGAGGDLGGRTVSWLPGRTATVMTIFALIAMAAYARYERLTAIRLAKADSPLDPPATRTSKAVQTQKGLGWIWALVSVISLVAALATYEQAVMLPAVLLAIAVTMRCERFKVRWLWQIGFWSLMVAYLIFRKAVMPTGMSSYQSQQIRFGPGVGISLFVFIAPFANGIQGFLITIQDGWITLLNAGVYVFCVSAASNLTSFYQARRQWVWALAGYGMSILAFLPMAWFKQFAHYSYWPIAIRSLFTMSLVLVAYELMIIACSPPTQQAPPRLDPAPGSLPRP